MIFIYIGYFNAYMYVCDVNCVIIFLTHYSLYACSQKKLAIYNYWLCWENGLKGPMHSQVILYFASQLPHQPINQ
jgi:hypothetical protein